MPNDQLRKANAKADLMHALSEFFNASADSDPETIESELKNMIFEASDEKIAL